MIDPNIPIRPDSPIPPRTKDEVFSFLKENGWVLASGRSDFLWFSPHDSVQYGNSAKLYKTGEALTKQFFESDISLESIIVPDENMVLTYTFNPNAFTEYLKSNVSRVLADTCIYRRPMPFPYASTEVVTTLFEGKGCSRNRPKLVTGKWRLSVYGNFLNKTIAVYGTKEEALRNHNAVVRNLHDRVIAEELRHSY